MTTNTAEALQALKEWVVQHGGICSPALSLVTEDGNTRAVASTDVAGNTTLVSTPHNLILDWSKVVKAVPQTILNHQVQWKNDIYDERPIWAVFLAAEYLKGDESDFWPYIRTLPQPSRIAKDGLFFGQDLGNVGKNTNLRLDLTTRITQWEKEFKWVKTYCALDSSEFWKTIAEKLTWEIFLWASLIYTSRAFPDSLLRVDGKQVDSRKLMTEVNEVDPGARPCLIPLLDMLNHRPYEKVVWMKGQSALSLISVEETKAGNELFNNYGPKSNAELIVGYGFAIKGNPFDFFPLRFAPPLNSIQQTIRKAQTTDVGNIFYLRLPEQQQNTPPIWRSPMAAESSIFPRELVTLVELAVASYRELIYLKENPNTSPISIRNAIQRDTQLLAAINSKINNYVVQGKPQNPLQEALHIYMDVQHAILSAAKAELQARLSGMCTLEERRALNVVTLEDLFATDKPFAQAIGETFGSENAEDLREAGYSELIFALGITRKYILYKRDPSSSHLPNNWRIWLEHVMKCIPFLGSEKYVDFKDPNWKEWEERRRENSWWVWQDILGGGDGADLFREKGWGLEAVLWGQRVWDDEGFTIGGIEGIGLGGFGDGS